MESLVKLRDNQPRNLHEVGTLNEVVHLNKSPSEKSS